MKIMVAGAGAFGKEHLKTLTAMGGMTLAVAERHTAECERVGKLFALADSDADAFALLERFQPDGVIVATPADAHAPLARAALARNIAVLVEKPVAPDVATMRELCEAARASRAFLQPGHILRFSAGHRRLLDVLREGEIGTLLRFASRRYRDAGHASRYVGIDPVLMTMIHDIDLALWFDGGVALRAIAFRGDAGAGRSLTSAWLESSSKANWHIETAWLHPEPECPQDRVEIVGAGGSAELFVGSHIEVHGASSRRIEIEASDDPLRTELDCFVAGIRAGKSLAPVSPSDALNGLVAADMILRALHDR